MSGTEEGKVKVEEMGSQGGAAIDQVVMNLPIPALKPGERIEDWKALFTAGVSTLLNRGAEGEVLAIGLLPAYLNRRTAERELVREVVRDCSTLKAAFEVLVSTLDPPLDKYQCMQEMCRLDWVPGVQLDDFFFELKRLGMRASADLSFICSLFVTQLPKEVQSKAKAWLADQGELDERLARGLVREAKGWLVERGIPLDRGSRQFVGAVMSDVMSQGANRSDTSACSHQGHSGSQCASGGVMSDGEKDEGVSHRVFAMQRKKGKVARCYICDSPNHLMFKCPSRHCAKCGKKGHSAKDCRVGPKVYRVYEGVEGTDERAVTLGVRLDDQRISAMLDSGASMSVIDERSVFDAQLGGKVEYANGLETVTGVGGKAVVIGTIPVVVDVGDDQKVHHHLKVLGGVERVVILGRDFLSLFPTTEFDWEGGRIRLGSKWKTPEVMMSGGQQDGRIAVAVLEGMTSPSESELRSRINPALPADQREKLLRILWDFRSVFAANPKKPSQTDLAEHDIDTGDARPVKQKSARMSPQMEEEVNKQLREMLDNGICRPSNSPWSSRVILVRKKDSSYRFVVDYRDLNSVTKKDAYPAANWQDILDKMDGSTVFSFLDGASAYWSVPIRECDKEKTAFAVPKGIYEMNVMAFGLCNSQSTYQRVIDKVLSDVPQVEAYIDDACVHTRDMTEHVTALKKTLEAYKKANMQLRLDKCQFGFFEGEFVGHEISGAGYRPLRCHVATIKEYPKPHTKKELQRFLGLVNFYRHYIPGMAQTAAPLYQLTRQDTKWEWTDECEASFTALRSALTERPVLAFPKWNKPFWVEVDASGVSVGGVLSQETEEGHRKPLAYFSSGLTAAQRNYSASELECWALVAAVRKWKMYLQAAAKIVLVTDHNPLVWLRKQRDPRHKFARWLMELESYNYDIIYRKGEENTAADCLSRVNQPVDSKVNDEHEHLERHVYNLSNEDLLDKIQAAQKLDPVTIFAVSQLIANGRVTRGRYRHYRGMSVRDGVLKKGNRIVLPVAVQREVIDELHRAGHWGTEKTLDVVRRQFFSPGLPDVVRSVCSECLVCSANKRSYQPQVEMQPYELSELAPRKTVAMDVGTLPWSEAGFRYFLVVVDLFSRFAEFIPMQDQTADTVVQSFRSGWVYNHGLPEILVSDQARNMDGETVRRFCAEFNIQKRRSSPYHPEGNGLAERCVQAAKQLLRCLLAERKMGKTEWPDIMKEVSFVFNSTKNSSTKVSPQEVMYGVTLRAPQSVTVSDPAPYVCPEDYVEETRDAQSGIFRRVSDNSTDAKNKSKEYYDRSKVNPVERQINAGDRVMLRNEERSGLDPLFRGPFVVTKTAGSNVFLRINDSERCVHMNRVKKIPGSPDSQDTPVSTAPVQPDGEDAQEPVGARPETSSVLGGADFENHDGFPQARAEDSASDIQPHPVRDPQPPVTPTEPGPEPDPLRFLPSASRAGRTVKRNPRYNT